MPVVSRFLGIVIAMYWDDHVPARFHAKYEEALESERQRLEHGASGPGVQGERTRVKMEIVADTRCELDKVRNAWEARKERLPENLGYGKGQGLLNEGDIAWWRTGDCT